MIQSHLSQQLHLIPWAIGSLSVFVMLFFAMLVWLFRPGSTSYYDRAASLPLKEGETHGS